MNKIHPEIKLFWEKSGYVIEPLTPNIDEYLDMSWWILKDNYPVDTVAMTHKNKPAEYYMEGKKYSEEEMLHLVKLRAFL